MSARLQAAGVAALGVFVFERASRMTNFWSDPGSPGLFPALVAAVFIICAVAIWRQGPPEDDPGSVSVWAILYALMVVAYGALLKPVGYIGASIAFLLVSFLWLRAMPWWKSILVAVVATGITFAVFRYLFIVILP
ncbi:MAG: tripartite tricarboxylate transporter TctB family protein [Armatimonadota bacterium]|nr:tripartite tricarboxylate transporter TctB family protein [Armatimonadota bacterium]MDR7498430.1 tripartite tricarboxylate transporter TctB family protein [Armatimonadota bacterium]MDR7557127.1 tripartite tricarboxylate transporter TctB family protein [Armatimonadota bacterium]MDR7571968.1 tripartite tricarboxylate transporter TctB family protein [Armatimonadota bacterium]